MDPLTRLVAIEDIKQLKSRYFTALDEKRWDEYASLFSPDAVIDFSQQPDLLDHGRDEADPEPNNWIFSGGRAAADFIEPLFAEVTSAHHGHDPRIELVDETTATGHWTLYDRLEYPDEVFHGYGRYDETYVKVDGAWVFSRLVLTRYAGAWETKTPVATAAP
jgi:hypothetical protein